MSRVVWLGAWFAICLGGAAACGAADDSPSDSNSNWAECSEERPCPPGRVCERSVCVSESSQSVESSGGRGGAAGMLDASASTQTSLFDAGRSPEQRDAAMPGFAPDGATVAVADARSFDADLAVDGGTTGRDAGSSTEGGASCAPVDPGVCAACTGIAVRTDTGQCGCICGDPTLTFENAGACVSACPETCVDETPQVLGTHTSDGLPGPQPPPPMDGGPGSCRVPLGGGVAYRTQSCLDERFGGTAPYTVEFGVTQVVEICESFGGCEWPIWVDAVRSCGVQIEVDYGVLSPCLTCDGQIDSCIFLDMPISALPIVATGTLRQENCAGEFLCTSTGGTWDSIGSTCSCGVGQTFDPVVGCV